MEMGADVTWRGGAPLLADDTLSAAGAAFLARETADERLAVLTLAGPRSGRRARASFVAELLGQSVDVDFPAEDEGGAEVVVVASVGCMEEDVTVVVLDASVDPRRPAAGDALAAAVCALSSLVLHCDDGRGDDDGATAAGLLGLSLSLASPSPPPSPPSFLASWPPFRALVGDLMKEFAAVEVFELLPRALTLDLSRDEALVAAASCRPSPAPKRLASESPSQLDDLLSLRAATAAGVSGVVSPRQVLQTGFLPFVRPLAPVKTLLGPEVTGETLHLMLRSLAKLAQARRQLDPHSDRDDAPLDLGSAWDELVETKCRAAAEDAVATYVDCLHPAARETPPMELGAFAKLHDDISRLSLDVFHSAAAAYPKSSARRRAVRRRLKEDIAARYEQELAVLRANSLAFCEALKSELWGKLSVQAVAYDSEEATSAGFDAMLHAVREFDAQYAEQARGPERDHVLRDFYRHEAVSAFERLKRAASERASEAHVQELRERLERDFDAKKQALVARFAAQEAQLRASVAREMEVMHKMQTAKLSRAKMDERDAARSRDTVAVLERSKSELEGKVAALEQAREDAQLQRTRLERQVGELEVAARREMASRAELVDTLAATIRAAEEKERALQEQVAALKGELGEKTFRVEGELRDLARQLHKTTEVRVVLPVVRIQWTVLTVAACLFAAGEGRAAEEAERVLPARDGAAAGHPGARVLRGRGRARPVRRRARQLHERVTAFRVGAVLLVVLWHLLALMTHRHTRTG